MAIPIDPMRIFISHNSTDSEIAQHLVDLISTGIGIAREHIFCSSADGIDVPAGADFQSFIKTELNSEGVVLPLITPNYYNSRFSMYELGAAWANSKKTIPIIIPPMDYGDLKDFLPMVIAVKANEIKGLNKLKDQLENILAVRSATSLWEKMRHKFIEMLTEIQQRDIDPINLTPKLPLIQVRNKYKLVAFDLDGTLLQGKDFRYSWQLVWKHLGYPEEKRKQLFNKHVGNSTIYPYKKWCDDCASFFIEKKLKKNDIKQIIQDCKLKQASGLQTTLEALKKRGIRTAIISGGIDTFFEFGIQPSARKLFDEVYINKFSYDDQGYLKSIQPHSDVESDFSGKLKVLEKICAKLNCNVNETVFVGEGINDKEIGDSPCLSIAYPAAHADGHFRAVANVELLDYNIAAILAEVLICD